MLATAIAVFSLAGGLWPFGADEEGRLADEETIGSLDGAAIEIPAEEPFEVDQRAVLEQYRQYLDAPAGDPAMRLEAMRRLGDLSLSVGEETSVDDPGYAQSMAYHEDAVRLYEQMLARHPDYAKADAVLYQLSRAYESLGRGDAALATLERLVREHPGSAHIDEAEFRRGELFFARSRFGEAARAYRSVVQIGERSAFYEQSLYKLGWAEFRQAGYDPAVHAFLDLLGRRLETIARSNGSENPEDALGSASRADRELLDDVLRVLSLSFSYLEGAASIDRYVADRGRKDPAALLFGALGALYLEKERYLDAAATFASFADSEPYHAQAPALSSRAIEAFDAGRFPTLVLEAKEDFVERYGLDGDYWSFHDAAARPDVVEPLKAHLGDLARHDHAAAQTSGAAADYARAAGWYRRYLDYFPDDPDSASRSFLLAEILTETGDFAEATRYYQQAAYDYPGFERAGESAYAGLLAANRHAATLSEAPRAEWEREQLRESLRFAREFPAHAQAAPVLSKAAENYFAAGEMDEAVYVAGRLLERHDEAAPELRRVAWTVAGHGHFDLGHYSRAERAYVRLRALGGGAALGGAELDERIAAAVYRQAEQAERAGSPDAAVAHYLRIETAAPRAAIRMNAVYDAASLQMREEDWEAAIATLNRYRRNYPETRYSDDVTQNLAVAYEATGRAAEAAREFERIATLASAGPETQREALWKSAELYEEAADLGAARRTWSRYLEAFPDPFEESLEVRLRLADLAVEDGDPAARTRRLKGLIAADAAAGAQRTLRSRTLAARAALELAEPTYAAFAAAALTIPLDRSLARKKTLMEAALAAYDQAAAYGVADVTTVATYRIGELYFRLSADLMDSERPADLDADALEQYEILLEEQAFPFEERAIDLYTANTARAADGLYDEWVVKSYARLAELMPARFAKYEKAKDHVANLY